MCRILGVKSNNYYSYQKRYSTKPEDPTHQEMIDWVKDIADFSDNTYGERRIQKVLNALSYPVSRRKTAQLMKEANVWVRYKKKYKVTTNSDHNQPIYPNVLEQNFNVETADQAWVQDCLFIEGKIILSLSAVKVW